MNPVKQTTLYDPDMTSYEVIYSTAIGTIITYKGPNPPDFHTIPPTHLRNLVSVMMEKHNLSHALATKLRSAFPSPSFHDIFT